MDTSPSPAFPSSAPAPYPSPLPFFLFVSFNNFRVPIYTAEKRELQCITYQRKQRGIIFTAAHKRNTKPLNVCPRVVRYTLLNSIAPRNWEMTLKMPYAQNKEPAKKKLRGTGTEIIHSVPHWRGQNL